MGRLLAKSDPAFRGRLRCRAADAGALRRQIGRPPLLSAEIGDIALFRRDDRALGGLLLALRPDRFREARLGAAQRVADHSERPRSLLRAREQKPRAWPLRVRRRVLGKAGPRSETAAARWPDGRPEDVAVQS